jgi:hypothetical protein
VHKGFSIAERVAYSADMFLKIKSVCLHVAIPEMHSFSMRNAKYFYEKPLPKYLDTKTVLVYCPHPVNVTSKRNKQEIFFFKFSVDVLKVTDQNSRIRIRIRIRIYPHQNFMDPQHC